MPDSRSPSRRENGATKRAVRQLMTVEEVAELLQVPVRTIYDWRYRGLGPAAIRVGRYVRYEPDEINRWLGSHRMNSWGQQSSRSGT